MKAKKYITGTMIILAGFMSLFPVHAADVPVIQVNMQGRIQTGHVTDGQRLGQGTIVFHSMHTGFRVWGDEQQSGDRPGRYMLAEDGNPYRKLRVRLEGDGWEPDNKDGKGIILYSGDEIGRFYIVADGEQTITAGRYSLRIGGAVVTSN
jgi:Enterobacteria AfaD invasin protein.